MKKLYWIGLLVFVLFFALSCSEASVDSDVSFVMDGMPLNVAAPSPNFVTNPNFDYPNEDGQRSFYGWEVSGCASLVRSPKPGAFKAGPTGFDGECLIGETAVISQTVVVTTTTVGFSMQPLIVGNGNHLIVTITDGSGWEWTPYESSAMDKNWDFIPFEITTLPSPTVTLRIEATYQTSLGIKVRGVTLQPED